VIYLVVLSEKGVHPYIYIKKIIMNRSYSKIRHIQEANAQLEKRVINEAPITGLSGAPNPAGTSKPVGAKAVNPGSVSKPKPNPVTGQGGGSNPAGAKAVNPGSVSKPKPNPVTSQSDASKSLVKPNLVIDCNRRVILNTNIHLLRDANYMVIDAFCTPSNRKQTGGK
jgi:hypothetical protein